MKTLLFKAVILTSLRKDTTIAIIFSNSEFKGTNMGKGGEELSAGLTIVRTLSGGLEKIYWSWRYLSDLEAYESVCDISIILSRGGQDYGTGLPQDDAGIGIS